MRTCTRCGQPKEPDQFYKHRTGKDGLHPQCKQCISELGRSYRAANAEACKARSKAYRESNKEKIKAANAAYHDANKERARSVNKAWREANKEAILTRVKAWQEANPEKVKAYKQRNKQTRKDTIQAEYERNKTAYFARAAERRATKTSRTPAWADKQAIANFYSMCRELNESAGSGAYHVDHIVPLKHPLVSGLHTDANLQILPSKENIAKHNRYWPDMP